MSIEKAELFTSHYEIYNVESNPLLLITDAQPVLVNTRLIVDGSEDFSSWYLSVRAGFKDLHESIDLIGQQMAGGVTPMRVISFDARTDVCQTVWEVGKGALDCDDKFFWQNPWLIKQYSAQILVNWLTASTSPQTPTGSSVQHRQMSQRCGDRFYQRCLP